MKINLISFTQLNASGGVPRFNRDLISFLQNAKHFSWFDMPQDLQAHGNALPEWEKAKVLNRWLRHTGKVKQEDIFIVDGFWGLGLEDCKNVISVSHGNWSHTTYDDVVLKGIKPEFPFHHAVQVDYRRNHLKRGGRIVAVSEFIAHQCKLQWNFDMTVINNGIDLLKFHPCKEKIKRNKPLIVHFTTNNGKGFDHINFVKHVCDADVLLLDEAEKQLGIPKYEALSQADIVVHPSAHEGNSYAVLETLSSGVPIVSYDVGLLYEARKNGFAETFGFIIDRNMRSPNVTADVLIKQLKRNLPQLGYAAREYARLFSIDNFKQNWLQYLKEEFGYANPC